MIVQSRGQVMAKIRNHKHSVSTDAILFGEITYDKEPYYKEFTDIMLDCSDNEKKYIMQAARYAKQLIHDIKS